MQNVDKLDFNAKEFTKVHKNVKKALKILDKVITSLSKRKVKEFKEKLNLIKRERTYKVENIKKQIRTLHKKLRLLEGKKICYSVEKMEPDIKELN